MTLYFIILLLITVRMDLIKVIICVFMPGSSPKPLWSVPHPTAIQKQITVLHSGMLERNNKHDIQENPFIDMIVACMFISTYQTLA